MVYRYRNEPYVVAVDLRNEIRPDLRIEGGLIPKVAISIPSWGTGDILGVDLAKFAPDFMNFTHPLLKSAAHRLLLLVIRLVVSKTKANIYDWHSAATIVGNKVYRASNNSHRLLKPIPMLSFLSGVFLISTLLSRQL